ncbi:MAG: formate dehydrogenase accessory sulfurtransferase FdhD [Actinomycetota bacterium]
MDTEDRLSISRPQRQVRARVARVEAGTMSRDTDGVVGEEPLEIRVRVGPKRRTLGVTMRTPGGDFELVAGFLRGEGVISTRTDVRAIRYCTDPDVDEAQMYNIVTADLAGDRLPDGPEIQRHFHAGSACGVCGKASLDALSLRGYEAITSDVRVTPDVLYALPGELRARQALFGTTGGLHAAGLFDGDGELLAVREDVGRHNAVDKLLGWALLEEIPLSHTVLMVSGRAGYEIAQKCLASRIPILCAVSAPSSLAVDLAERFGITLIGFLRERRFNIYAGEERVVFA